MKLGNRIALISDVHGEHRILRDVLGHCRRAEVEQIVLLGDLFDRVDHAEACLQQLADWPVTGVMGNHEHEALLQAGIEQLEIEQSLGLHLVEMRERLVIEDATFVHDEFGWKPNGSHPGEHRQTITWVTFAGHTHFRSARDDNGPIDLTMGRIQLSRKRRYLINPGAVVEGQFAVWDRARESVIFHRV